MTKKREPQNIHLVGGRGSGRPKDRFYYGSRICILANILTNPRDAEIYRRKLEREGILAVVRKWYSQWPVYRCGARKR